MDDDKCLSCFSPSVGVSQCKNALQFIIFPPSRVLSSPCAHHLQKQTLADSDRGNHMEMASQSCTCLSISCSPSSFTWTFNSLLLQDKTSLSRLVAAAIDVAYGWDTTSLVAAAEARLTHYPGTDDIAKILCCRLTENDNIFCSAAAEPYSVLSRRLRSARPRTPLRHRLPCSSPRPNFSSPTFAALLLLGRRRRQ